MIMTKSLCSDAIKQSARALPGAILEGFSTEAVAGIGKRLSDEVYIAYYSLSHATIALKISITH